SIQHTPPTDIYTLSLHDALPICRGEGCRGKTRPAFRHSLHRGEDAGNLRAFRRCRAGAGSWKNPGAGRGRRKTTRRETKSILDRSEEHTSELQSRFDLVCRLLLE